MAVEAGIGLEPQDGGARETQTRTTDAVAHHSPQTKARSSASSNVGVDFTEGSVTQARELSDRARRHVELSRRHVEVIIVGMRALKHVLWLT